MSRGNGGNDYQEAMHQAYLKDNLGLFNAHISKGADPSLPDPHNGRTMIEFIAAHGGIDFMESLANRKFDLDAQSEKDGMTPLMLAAEKGQIEMVVFLVRNGADLNKKDNESSTVKDIVKKAIDKHDSISKMAPDAQEKSNVYANQRQNLVTVQNLVNEENLNQNVELSLNQENPLLFALTASNPDKTKPDLDDRFELVERLIEKGADVNAQDEKGRTPLSMAIKMEGNRTAGLLFKNGADVTKLRDLDVKRLENYTKNSLFGPDKEFSDIFNAYEKTKDQNKENQPPQQNAQVSQTTEPGNDTAAQTQTTGTGPATTNTSSLGGPNGNPAPKEANQLQGGRAVPAGKREGIEVTHAQRLGLQSGNQGQEGGNARG